MDESIELTAHNTKLTLTIAFNYGGRAELIDAVRKIESQGMAVNERTIEANLYDPEAPEVDLFVRTSGESRTSNFMLWQAAYAELVFIETYWPDFRRQHLADAVAEFQRRERRFGGLNTG